MIEVLESALQKAAGEGMDEFIQAFTDKYKEIIGGELTAETMPLLTGEQHSLLAYQIFRDEIMVGGFCQLIQNGYGGYIFDNPFAKVMRLWGAEEFSKLVYKAKKIFDANRKDLEKERTDDEFMAMYEQYEAFDELEETYLEMEEQVTALIASYVDDHLELFVMGMSVTSCMNGDDNHNVTMTVPVKYNYSSFLMGDGTTKLVPTTELGLLDGIMYIISCQYDQSQVSANSNSIPVTLLSTPLCIDPKGDESLSTTKTEPTNPLYTLDKQQSSLVYYDKNTIVLTMPYWVKVTNSSVEESELKKHSFCLSYNPDEIESNATKLNLYISHRVEDGEESVTRSNFTYAYRAYSISSALYQFKEKTGKLPQYLVLKAETNSSKDELKDENGETSVEYQYAFTE